MAALVDGRQVGVIGVDNKGAVLEANDRGREVLHLEGGLRERNGLLRADRPKDGEALEDVLGQVLRGETKVGVGGVTTVGGWPDQRPLTVYVNKVDGSCLGVAAVVVVVDPWRRMDLRPRQVAKSLGLTPAESGVAVALAEGMTAGEIAKATNRKVPTVRWLVQQALSRTWCSRQTDLVRLVLASSHLPVVQSE